MRNFSLVVLIIVVLTGCGRHMKQVNTIGENMNRISPNISEIKGEEKDVQSDEEQLGFTPYRVIKISMPLAAFFSEGIFGGNYYISLKKEGAENTDDIKKSGEFYKSEIVVENGEPKLYYFDMGKEIDLDRKVLAQTRVVSGGHQHSVDGSLICGQWAQQFDWGLFKTINEYVDEGFITITEIDSEEDENHAKTVKIIDNIAKRYLTYRQDSPFERVLKGFGEISSDQVQLMVVGTISPIQIYPVIAVKLFDIMHALSGQVDINQPGYETSQLTAFQQGVAFSRYMPLVVAKIQKQNYELNRIENAKMLVRAVKNWNQWKKMSEEKLLRWIGKMRGKYSKNSKKLVDREKEYDIELKEIKTLYENAISALEEDAGV